MTIAYLIAKTMEDGSWTGGLLITDERGLPIDFHYIEPIRPSKIQKLIYGSALKRYLLLDAIAATLLSAMDNSAEWVFTSDPLMLELDDHDHGRIIAITPGESEPVLASGEWRKDATGKIAIQTQPTDNPLAMEFISPDDTDTEKIASAIAELSHKMDLSEPLARVGEALSEICRNGKV